MITAHIEQITPALTWQLRRNELYPDKDYLDMAMPEDTSGTHFGAFAENKLVGVVSLFHNGTDFYFREFAVSNSVSRQGIGKQLLAYMTNYAITEGATRLWCNVCISAKDFLCKSDFLPIGNVFEKDGKDYVKMERIFDFMRPEVSGRNT